MRIYNKNGTLIGRFDVLDTSTYSNILMGDEKVELVIESPTRLSFPVGSYANINGKRFYVFPTDIPKETKRSTKNYNYAVVMYTVAQQLHLCKVSDISGRYSFDLTATQQEHLQLIVDNLNARDSGWTIGNVDNFDMVVSLTYEGTTAIDALRQIADIAGTEFSVSHDKTVSLDKMEANKDNPMTLSYHNGLKPNVNIGTGENKRCDKMLIKGSDRNIIAERYGNKTLLLPRSVTLSYDGGKFSDEDGFDSTKAVTFCTDTTGRHLTEQGYISDAFSMEDTCDCTEIYPSHIGVVTNVQRILYGSHVLWNVIDMTIPQTLDFSQHKIPGKKLTIIFQSGQLAGKEFHCEYNHTLRRFEIENADIDGSVMPSDSFPPVVGDTYIIVDCEMPFEYICDNANKSGAEWDAMRKMVVFMFDRMRQQYNVDAVVDSGWLRRNWEEVGERFAVGECVTLEDVVNGEKDFRITEIRSSVNDPCIITSIKFSNALKRSSFLNRLDRMNRQIPELRRIYEVQSDHVDSRFGSVYQQFMTQVNDAVPALSSIQMNKILTEEKSRLRFLSEVGGAEVSVDKLITLDNTTKKIVMLPFVVQSQYLQTAETVLGNITKPYKTWRGERMTYEIMRAEIPMYVYVKASNTDETAEWQVSTEKVGREDVEGYQMLLIGAFNPERDGVREFIPLFIWLELKASQLSVERITFVDEQGKTTSEITGSSALLKEVYLDESEQTALEKIADIDQEIKDVAKSVGKIEGQTITIGKNSVKVVSDVTVEGESAVGEDGKAAITYVDNLDKMKEDDKRAARAAAVLAKFNSINKVLEEKFDIEFVDVLPEEGMSKYTIYIVYNEKKKVHVQYIYHNSEWVVISSGYLEIPLASRTNDGLMSSGHYAKLDDIGSITAEDVNELFNN